MTLYDLVISKIEKMVASDLGNLFIQYQTHLECDYYLESIWTLLPNVKMSMSFKDMLSNMVSDILARQHYVFPNKSIIINTRDLINEFFNSVPEMDPNITFLPKNNQGEFMTYKDFFALSNEQLKFLMENIRINE
jgi:hypothetical protein